ncbi:MAG: hypothetical protein K9M54_11580 [Kiritimatiellales bacterium]|nr:hypothetical protein [Kiritimatiellales bacterium]MCF7864155.1 hypothetical protein [Kiritimatiellales bacterium]
MIEAIRKYLSEVEAEYRRGNATEHSYRPALKTLYSPVQTLEKLCTTN